MLCWDCEVKIMYQVLNNGRPADCNEFNVLSSLNQSIYINFDDAKRYAMKWVHEEDYDNVDWNNLKPNVPVDYDGCGDTLEIRNLSKRK